MLAALEKEHILFNARLVQNVSGSSSVCQLALHCKEGSVNSVAGFDLVH
jgi:hypothetical protein